MAWFGGGAMTLEFKIVEDNGRITYICAKNRTEAIKYFCEEKGCPRDFVKNHCIVTCEGRVTGWR